MTLKEQLAQTKAQLKEIVDGRPKFYRAWADTWATFHENPAAYHEAHAILLKYDIAKNKVVDEVKRLQKVVDELEEKT